MMHIGLTEGNGESCACGYNRPIGGCVKTLTPYIRALDLGAEKMHHGSDELAGLQTITTICPYWLFRFFCFAVIQFWRWCKNFSHLPSWGNHLGNLYASFVGFRGRASQYGRRLPSGLTLSAGRVMASHS